MTKRTRREPHLSDRQRRWYEKTPKWKLMVIVKHLAARTNPDFYNTAIDSGNWFALLLKEEALLKHHQCFRSDSTRW